MPLAQKVAVKIKEVLGPAGFNIMQNNGKAAGQEVFHYHLHIIPRYVDDDGFKIRCKSKDVDVKELEEVAAKLSLNP